MSSDLIFVTGASGFLGSHIIAQLLEKGYRVRATARGAKLDDLKKRHADAGDAFEVIGVNDLATDQFPDALQGVDAVIHSGSPLAGRGAPEEVFKGAIEGSLNVIRQAEKAGIKKVIVTGSVAAIMNPKGLNLDTEWNPITKEAAIQNGSPMVVYAASKALSERAVWDFAEAHPHVEITVFNPPFFYGPFAPGFELPTPDFTKIGSNILLHRILRRDGVFPSVAYIDVRDAARAHILALKAGPALDGRPKRLPIASPEPFNWKNVIDFIVAERPELKDRLADPAKAPIEHGMGPPDFERLERVVGFRESEFVGWKKTVLETVDALVGLERLWKEKGYEVEIPIA